MDITILPTELQEQIANVIKLKESLEEKYGIDVILKFVKMYDAFYSKINKKGSPRTNHSLSGCWTHSTAASSSGYGQIWINNKPWNLHRLSWFLHNGCPENQDHSFYRSHKYHVAHLCDNKECCNPEHLQLQTCEKNIQDGVKLRDADKKPKEIIRNSEPCYNCVEKHKSCDGGIPCDRCKELKLECVKKEHKTHSGTFVKGQGKGESNTNAKYSDPLIQEIQAKIAVGLPYGGLKKLAEEYSIPYATMQKIASGKYRVDN
jgi:hypothetical protein